MHADGVSSLQLSVFLVQSFSELSELVLELELDSYLTCHHPAW